MADYQSHFDGRVFANPVPTEVMQKGAMGKMLRDYLNKPKDHQPLIPPGPFKVDIPLLTETRENELRVTWLGHSTTLIEVNGKKFLTDPVWSKRVSPFSMIGPVRFFDAPISLAALPAIDYVLLSHDHYDHLDRHTILYLASRNIPIITMLRVGQRLMKWGVKKSLITELDWWQELDIFPGLKITALPARHFSGRWLNDRFTTLWGSFSIKGNHHVYFGADSGYYPGFKTIGEKLGPFDLTMLDTGAYNELWESIHMGPENAVQAHLDLRGKILMPIHWGTFSLANHPWKEPVERIIQEAEKKEVSLFIPRPGETRTISGAYNSAWWNDNKPF